jgi:hypothetical protein
MTPTRRTSTMKRSTGHLILSMVALVASVTLSQAQTTDDQGIHRQAPAAAGRDGTAMPFDQATTAMPFDQATAMPFDQATAMPFDQAATDMPFEHFEGPVSGQAAR